METNYKVILDHVITNALLHMDALSIEISKIDLEKLKNDNPEKYSSEHKRATMIELTMIAINDIIHPAHYQLEEICGTKDTSYYNQLRKAHDKAKEIGLLFKGCKCPNCESKKSESEAQ